MLSKDDFVARASKGSAFSARELSELDRDYESAANTAEILAEAMPSVGFMSVERRLAAFFAVCRHLDQLISQGTVSPAAAQLSLLVLRLANASFQKAVIMFDTRHDRFDARARAEMPQSAQVYLAGLRRYG